MTQTIIRRVLISDRDLGRMEYECLVISPCGHKKLYDTCEWRSLTSNDLLIDLIKYNEKQSLVQYFKKHRGSLYDQTYTQDYILKIDEGRDVIGRKKHSRYWYRFGWATVTKTKS